MLATDDGPRVAALAFDGWDMRANEGGATGQLATRLSGLDGAFEELETGLGEHWMDTAVLAVTEFGRTARINGTGGSDHGTGAAAFLAGGAVKGGRVIADWPGLKSNQLYQGRDLAPTTDLRAVLKGLLADLFGVSPSALGDKVFPTPPPFSRCLACSPVEPVDSNPARLIASGFERMSRSSAELPV